MREPGEPPPSLEDTTSVFDSAAIGMAIVAFDGKFLKVNRALCELLQRSAEELLVTTWPAVTHPEDVGLGMEQARRALAGEHDTFQLQKRYLRPDGSYVSTLLNVSVLRDRQGRARCMFTQVTDLSPYERAEEALSRLAAIANASDEAIVGCSPDGSIIAWNRGAEVMFGYSGQELAGRHISTIVPPELRADVDRTLANLAVADQVVRTELVFVPKHGEPIDVAVTMSPIRSGEGPISGVSLVARDVTEQRWLARTLDDTLAALERALDQARASERRSQQFLADAAHQLRTPIAGIQACSETLLRGAPPDQVDSLLMHLVRETARASRLMRSLLRMAHLDKGETPSPEPCDLGALCADEVARALTLAPRLAITFAVRSGAVERPRLDSHTVREIVANLLDNARRHARSRIDVLVDIEPHGVEIRVVDDGSGLADDVVELVFERFVSLDGESGSGLGLPIARELARSHGGDVTYELGSFVVRLSSILPATE